MLDCFSPLEVNFLFLEEKIKYAVILKEIFLNNCVLFLRLNTALLYELISKIVVFCIYRLQRVYHY